MRVVGKSSERPKQATNHKSLPLGGLAQQVGAVQTQSHVALQEVPYTPLVTFLIELLARVSIILMQII